MDAHRANAPDFSPYFARNKRFSDLQAFRAAPAFIEYDAFRNLRAALQQIFDEPEYSAREVSAPDRFESEFFATASSVDDILPPSRIICEPLPDAFHNATAGMLSRSCALAKVAECGADFLRLKARKWPR